MAQQGLGSEHRNKCGHEGCTCLIAPGDHFCSEYCASSSNADISGTVPGGHQQQAGQQRQGGSQQQGGHQHHGGSCACGHAECSGHAQS